MPRRILPLLWTLLALSSASCTDPRPDADAGTGELPPAGPASLEPDRGFVRYDHDSFLIHGDEYVPEGIGSYPLLEHAGKGRLEFIEQIFSQAHDLGRPLLRTNAFFDGGSSPARLRNDDGSLHEPGLRGLDRLLDTAARHGVRLILVLTNNWEDYGGAPAVVRSVGPGLPKDAFWSHPAIVEAQLDYVVELVSRTNTVNGVRYGDDPTVFAWELVNEARCTHPDWCDYRTLERWAAAMVDALRDAGAQQLLAWGGSGHEGRHGEYLSRIARHAGVDVLTLHVYPFAHDPNMRTIEDFDARVQAAANAGAERIRQAAELAHEYGLPLLVEELGWLPQQGPLADTERALVLAEWLKVASRHRAGTLPWMIAEPERRDYDGLLIRPDVHVQTARAIRWP